MRATILPSYDSWSQKMHRCESKIYFKRGGGDYLWQKVKVR